MHFFSKLFILSIFIQSTSTMASEQKYKYLTGCNKIQTEKLANIDKKVGDQFQKFEKIKLAVNDFANSCNTYMNNPSQNSSLVKSLGEKRNLMFTNVTNFKAAESAIVRELRETNKNVRGVGSLDCSKSFDRVESRVENLSGELDAYAQAKVGACSFGK